jgi:hypothetical protein
VNNIRYITATKIGEWERDKLCRFALLMRGKEPIVWDFGSAAVHHRLYCDWLVPDNVKAGMLGMRGTVPPAAGLMQNHAEEIASLLREAGVAKMPLGVDLAETAMFFELEKAGLKVVDGQQVMLDAREIKNIDEIVLLEPGRRDGRRHLPDDLRGAEARSCARRTSSPRSNELLYRSDRTTSRPSTPSPASAATRTAQLHRPHRQARRPGVLRHPAVLPGLSHVLLPHLQCRAGNAVQNDAYKNAASGSTTRSS